MIRNVTCIECPTGCRIAVAIESGLVVDVEGHGCRKGYDYAVAECVHPKRTLTTTIPAVGLSARVVPVKTSSPIPRDAWRQAMDVIRRARITHPVQAGDVIIAGILGLAVDVIVTRDVS